MRLGIEDAVFDDDGNEVFSGLKDTDGVFSGVGWICDWHPTIRISPKMHTSRNLRKCFIAISLKIGYKI